MDRLTRGFHRIGLVIAVPLLLLTAFSFAFPFFSTTVDNGSSARFMGMMTLLAAAISYAICRALAWIINGFREPA